MPGFVRKVPLQRVQVQHPPPLKIAWVLVDNGLKNPPIFLRPVHVPTETQNYQPRYNWGDSKQGREKTWLL